MKLNLFPLPRKVQVKKTKASLLNKKWILLPEQCSSSLRERILEGAEKIGRLTNQVIRIGSSVPDDLGIFLKTEVKTTLTSQEYKLEISKAGCHLQAGDEAGIYYGFLALVQLIEQFGSTLPVLSISDSPDFPSRGVMLDVSRCKVPTMETLKQLIDRLAGMRINQVQLYIEHTFAFAKHESVWHDASPFTHEEILELDDYCKDRYIELVPNLNSFGHLNRWLKHPEYTHLSEVPEGLHPDCLAPNQASLNFLEELYDEYLPHFSTTLFNVGCDETWQLGKGRSKKAAEKTSVTKVYLEFLKKIHKLVSKKGSKMQFWGDIILHQPELIKELPKDIVALNWGYDADHPYKKECPAFASSGIEFWVCPGTSSWNSITGRTDNCLTNLGESAKYGSKHGATGYLNTDWGDGGHHQVLPISYLGFTAGAGFSWNYKANQNVDLAGAISRHFFEDSTGKLGQFCLDLGRTLNHLPGLRRNNSSAIGQLLQMSLPSGRLDISKLTRGQFNKAEAWLDKISADLMESQPECSDRDLVTSELKHALAMSRHAIKRGRFKRLGDGTLEELKKEFQSIIMNHEEQWLARNRRGGLRESSGYLYRAMERFDQEPEEKQS